MVLGSRFRVNEMENHFRELIPVINALYDVLDVVVVRGALLTLLVVGARELVKGHRRV